MSKLFRGRTLRAPSSHEYPYQYLQEVDASGSNRNYRQGFSTVLFLRGFCKPVWQLMGILAITTSCTDWDAGLDLVVPVDELKLLRSKLVEVLSRLSNCQINCSQLLEPVTFPLIIPTVIRQQLFETHLVGGNCLRRTSINTLITCAF